MRGFFLFIILFFLIVIAEHSRTHRVVLSYEPEAEVIDVQSKIPAQIDIPSILSLNLEPATLKDGKWPVSQDSALFLTNSALPGYQGNIVIYAHNWPELFGKLQTVKPDQLITLTTKDGHVWKYKVSQKFEVDSDQNVWVQPTKTEVLTLYTCSGVFDRKRLIVRAVPAFN